MAVHWNSSLAQAYVNASLCGSVESGYGTADGNGWGIGESKFWGSLLVGAWRGAPDSSDSQQMGGFYSGLLDNLEVCMRKRHGMHM